jgi:hypothetical protein
VETPKGIGGPDLLRATGAWHHITGWATMRARPRRLRSQPLQQLRAADFSLAWMIFTLPADGIRRGLPEHKSPGQRHDLGK